MRFSLLLFSIFLSFSVNASTSSQDPEILLNLAFDEINQGRLELALNYIEIVLRNNPNFRLAQLIKGDLLLARARPIKTLGNTSNGSREQLADLRAEAVARLKAYRERPPTNKIPRYLLQLEPQQKYAVIVDATKSRLYLFQNTDEVPRFVADYYISIGKQGIAKSKRGDQKTPIGVYYIINNLSKDKLSDFYGHGAFPLDYPNEWDKRLGKNGHGIWLHGTPSDTYSRPPRASDGCVVLSNQDFDLISKSLQVGLTPVIISDRVEWLSLDEWNNQRQNLRQAIENWRQDWESLNTERYIKHYSKNFWTTDGQNFSIWRHQKVLVNNNKTWVKVNISDLSMFHNPGRETFIVVNFEQDYRSNNLSTKIKKRQYWVMEDNQWKIVYEGAV